MKMIYQKNIIINQPIVRLNNELYDNYIETPLNGADKKKEMLVISEKKKKI